MRRIFELPKTSKPKKQYGKQRKAKMIVMGYRYLQDNIENESASELVREFADRCGVNYTTMRYWLKHYEAWLYDPTHNHICIDGVKNELVRFELQNPKQ